jgi:hypothetical protein
MVVTRTRPPLGACCWETKEQLQDPQDRQQVLPVVQEAPVAATIDV